VLPEALAERLAERRLVFNEQEVFFRLGHSKVSIV
jgi:hypothetical protein